jgi:hypothetical protein
MDDAVFEVHVPVCKFCLNMRDTPDEPFTCAVMGEIPEAIGLISLRAFVILTYQSNFARGLLI